MGPGELKSFINRLCRLELKALGQNVDTCVQQNRRRQLVSDILRSANGHLAAIDSHGKFMDRNSQCTRVRHLILVWLWMAIALTAIPEH